LRPSVLLSYDGHNVLIDTTPDFRTQALRAGIRSLDAVLYTHSHADHIMGMDDIRPFNFSRPSPIPIYGDAHTIADLRRVFKYVFDDEYPYSAIPKVSATVLNGSIDLFGATFEPVTVKHGPLPITAYRFGPNAYVTDFSELPPDSLERLRGLDLIILDALRHRPHPTHSHLANSVQLVEQLGARRAYFTHICHELPHAATNAGLPENVKLAYDGLSLEIDI
jgi:phosphoribosyl 1,2-cyclic phosphate phosphodiesterase